ncbi:hypothetical protein MSC49_30000 [Methylosinus sp. C49]|uniref:TniQ family protein n=1 Tax=Methylosinus sp. C49 TaxID=2699395 RepID=UPI001366DDDB|nr:TniQ family protein [Methylosinus sp. C49]BBU63065.1 hypothetical protein MSC49_30000 [Methylosinus sp. C49]
MSDAIRLPSPLRLRAPRLPIESAQGHLMRMFEINGEPWSRERFRSRGLNLAEFMLGDVDASLRAFIGADPADFAASTARVISKKQVLVAGEILHRDDWTTRTRRWCPACWRQDFSDETIVARSPGWRVHRRFWWDVASVLTCPIHAVRLEVACPTCGDPLTWESGGLTMCRNRHGLLDCRPVAVPPAHVRADAYIVGRLGGAPRVAVPFLDRLSLREARDVMGHLGAAAVDGAFGALGKIDVARHPEAFSAGFNVAAGWPASFDALLDAVAARDDVGLGSWGVDQVYGYLVMWARSIKTTPAGKDLLDAIHAHHARRSFVHRRGAAAAFVGEDTPVSVNDIAVATGRSQELIARYLKAMDCWPAETRRGTPVAVSRSVLKEIVDLFEESLSAQSLDDALGLDGWRTFRVVGAFLKPMEIHVRYGAKTPYYSRADVADLVRRLAGDAASVAAAPAGMEPLVDVANRRSNGGIVRALQMVLDGELRVRARLAGVAGIAGLLISAVDFKRPSRVAEGTVDIDGVAALLGVHRETAYAILDAGLMARVTDEGKAIRTTPENVDAFRREFVTATDLAAELRTKPKYVIPLLADVGVVPVLARDDNPRCRVTVYRRADVPADWKARYRERYGR